MTVSSHRKECYQVPIYVFKVSSQAKVKWLQAIKELKATHPKVQGSAFDRGHKIRVNLFEDSRFLEFKDIVFQNAMIIANDISLDLNRMDVVLKHAWASINKKHDFNEFHTHSNCDFSGTYYLKSLPVSGNLRFRDPRESIFTRTPLFNGPSVLLQDVSFEPIEDTMIFFPSWLSHQAEPNPIEFERISLSFNICFELKNEIGNKIQDEW